MNFRYPSHRIHEIVNEPKCLTSGQELEFENKGEHGTKWDHNLELLDGPHCDLRYLGKAADKTRPTTYDVSLLLDQQRVRGVGYQKIGRQNFRAKLRIPKGWHQNIIDPNLPTNDPARNRHVPLDDFAPTDLADFVRQTAAMWAIDLGWEADLV